MRSFKLPAFIGACFDLTEKCFESENSRINEYITPPF